MVRSRWLLVGVLGIWGCVSGPEMNGEERERQSREESCRGECVQPPLLRAELLGHLIAEQARILAREDYKKNVPPLITDVAYEKIPEEPLRDGEEALDENGEPYQGDLNWHRVEFEALEGTETFGDRRFRNREVSGSHCYFAREPNKMSPVFSMVVVHHRDRGDQLYFGGPRQTVTRVDTVSLTEHHRTPVRFGESMRCVFRDDENLVGAVILPFEYSDVEAPSNGPHWAVVRVGVSDVLRPTGRKEMIKRASGRGGAMEVEEVDELIHPLPELELIGSYPSYGQALQAAEEVIPSGRFRLRREFVYPRMPYLSYVEGEVAQFCPVQARCEEPPEQLDVNARPTLSRERIQELEAARESSDEEEDLGSLEEVEEEEVEEEER